MPITFDFDNGGARQQVLHTNTTQTNQIVDVSEQVRFTISADTLDGTGRSVLNGAPEGKLGFADLGQDDTFRLTFEHTTDGDNVITGTTANPIVLDVDVPISSTWGAWRISFTNSVDGGTQVFSRTGTANGVAPPDISVVGSFTGIKFTSTGGGSEFATFASLTVNDISCFVAGTRIATPAGPRAIETLAPGDLVMRADGGTTAVVWLGRQEVDTRLAHPAKVNPICITAGTLGNARDLWVSPDHGIALDGHLINASALMNGDTVYQVAEMPRQGFTYYHVETERHELILAEGIAAETYLDMPSRDSFDNGTERANAPMIHPMALPRISSARLLPANIAQRLRRLNVA